MKYGVHPTIFWVCSSGTDYSSVPILSHSLKSKPTWLSFIAFSQKVVSWPQLWRNKKQKIYFVSNVGCSPDLHFPSVSPSRFYSSRWVVFLAVPCNRFRNVLGVSFWSLKSWSKLVKFFNWLCPLVAPVFKNICNFFFLLPSEFFMCVCIFNCLVFFLLFVHTTSPVNSWCFFWKLIKLCQILNFYSEQVASSPSGIRKELEKKP